MVESIGDNKQRCPHCGMLLSRPHLRNCPIYRQNHRNEPTPKMIDFAQDLARQLGREIPDGVDFQTCSNMIDKMKEELGYE